MRMAEGKGLDSWAVEVKFVAKVTNGDVAGKPKNPRGLISLKGLSP